MTRIRWHRIVTETVPPTLQFLIEAGVDAGEAHGPRNR